jgi:predicted TIM-barrel fold metal-dependent hydrolase
MIDFHCHPPGWRRTRTPYHLAPSTGDYVRYLHRAGLRGAVLLAHDGLSRSTPDSNDDLAAFAAARPDRFFGFGTVYAPHPHAPAEARRCLTDLGLRGIKLHPWLQGVPMHHAGLGAVLDVITEHRGILLVHDGTPPYAMAGQIAAAARRHPELPVVLGHGGLHDTWREALALTISTPNLYLCLCGTPPYAARAIVRNAPPDKVLFGTDAGLASGPAQEYAVARVRELADWGITEADRERILTTNPARLLGIDPLPVITEAELAA